MIGGENVELESVLGEISNLINSTKFDSFHLVGDLNCEFLRNSSHVETIKEFMSRNNMYSLWRDYQVDFTHTFQKEDGNCFMNTLDHILTLSKLSIDVVDAGVIHHIDNMSDHEPIYAVIKVDESESEDACEAQPIRATPKPNWEEASSDQKLEFNDVLFRKLSSMIIPAEVTECTDLHCKSESHKVKIDECIEPEKC